MRPFFPPLEPLQSVNLRAALFRALSELKKDGFLGRDVVLRKNMLDECRGDKFHEMLVVFSMLVLQRSITQDIHCSALRIITSPSASAEQDMIIPLILAYRSSMASIARRGRETSVSYETVNKLLIQNEADLDLAAKHSADKPIAKRDADFDMVRQELIISCSGSEEWIDAILEGGCSQLFTPLLGHDSEASLSMKGDAHSSCRTTDLLTNLEDRLSDQQSRLQHWRKFEQVLTEGKSSVTAPEPSSHETFAFREHQRLTVDSVQPCRESTKPKLPPEYASLLSSLEAELTDNVKGKPEIQPSKDCSLNRILPRFNYSPDSFSVPNVMVNLGALNLNSPRTSIHSSVSPRSESVANTDWEDISEAQTPLQNPSPVPSQPSLSSSDTKDNTNPDRELSLSNSPRPGIATTLMERTRQSLSMLPPPRSQPHVSLAANLRQPRPSFPVNQFEASEKQKAPEHGSGASTPREELFSTDDYASVFKSRPRIALSPVASPSPDTSMLDDGIDSSNVESSPLLRSRFTRI